MYTEKYMNGFSSTQNNRLRVYNMLDEFSNFSSYWTIELENQTSLLESTINESDRVIVEAKMEVLREGALANIWEKVKNFFKMLANKTVKMIAMFRKGVGNEALNKAKKSILKLKSHPFQYIKFNDEGGAEVRTAGEMLRQLHPDDAFGHLDGTINNILSPYDNIEGRLVYKFLKIVFDYKMYYQASMFVNMESINVIDKMSRELFGIIHTAVDKGTDEGYNNMVNEGRSIQKKFGEELKKMTAHITHINVDKKYTSNLLDINQTTGGVSLNVNIFDKLCDANTVLGIMGKKIAGLSVKNSKEIVGILQDLIYQADKELKICDKMAQQIKSTVDFAIKESDTIMRKMQGGAMKGNDNLSSNTTALAASSGGDVKYISNIMSHITSMIRTYDAIVTACVRKENIVAKHLERNTNSLYILVTKGAYHEEDKNNEKNKEEI